MLVYLLAYPVLVVEIVDPVEEGWLLLGIGAVQVESFGLLVPYRIRPGIIERVVVG